MEARSRISNRHEHVSWESHSVGTITFKLRYLVVSTTTTELQNRADRFCDLRVTDEDLFGGWRDFNSLEKVWTQLFVFAVVLRVVSMALMVISRNNGFSYIRKRIRKLCRCGNRTNEQNMAQQLFASV